MNLRLATQPNRRCPLHAPSVVPKLLVRACPWRHAAQRQALVVRVAAGITGARLSVTALGRAMDSSAAVKPCLKRADRLLSNPQLRHERRGG
jgi:hypothetical protein